jgi:hypothetical protein
MVDGLVRELGTMTGHEFRELMVGCSSESLYCFLQEAMMDPNHQN